MRIIAETCCPLGLVLLDADLWRFFDDDRRIWRVSIVLTDSAELEAVMGAGEVGVAVGDTLSVAVTGTAAA